MDILLTEVETRVLGSLIEKELTTPEYYPLSLNALVNACNQKSNRDPVMNLDEEAVSEAMRALDKKGLAGAADNMVSRVTKYEHRLQEATTSRGTKSPSWPSCSSAARKRPANCAAAPTACTNSTTWASCNPRCKG